MDIQMIGDVLMFYSYGCLSCMLSVYDIQLQKTNYRCDFYSTNNYTTNMGLIC